MHVCFCYLKFSFSVLSQEIGREKRLRNDLFCVGWDVKLSLNQLTQSRYLFIYHVNDDDVTKLNVDNDARL